MKAKKVITLSILILIMFGVHFFMIGLSFIENPTYTDDFNDHTQPSYPSEDIWYIWIDNNATHIMFKVEFNGSWIAYTDLGIYISTNDNTGSNDSTGFAMGAEGPLDFLADYCLYVNHITSDFCYLENESDDTYTLGPNDIEDASGNLTFGGLGYVIFSNNNRTVEIGYKLQTSVGGNGYLNIAIGQTIKIKLKCFQDSDFAPDLGENPIIYTLTSGQDLTWVIILAIVLPIVGVALGLFWYYRRRE